MSSAVQNPEDNPDLPSADDELSTLRSVYDGFLKKTISSDEINRYIQSQIPDNAYYAHQLLCAILVQELRDAAQEDTFLNHLRKNFNDSVLYDILSIAIRDNHLDTATKLARMIELGKVNFNEQNENIASLLIASIAKGYTAIALKLIKTAPSLLEIKDIDGKCPIHYATLQGNHEVAAKLIEKGINLNSPDSRGYSPLCRAVEKKDMTMAELLLQGGALVNTSHDIDPLMVSCAVKDCEEFTALMLANGAIINKANSLGETPRSTAVKYGNDKAFTVLKAARNIIYQTHGADSNRFPLILEDYLKAASSVSTLPLANAKRVFSNLEAYSALHIAAIQNKPELAELLIGHGVNTMTKDHAGNLPIHHATSHPRVLRLMLDKDSSQATAKNSRGETPIHVAIRRNCGMDSLVLIHRNLTDINIVDRMGLNPIKTAIAAGNSNALLLLLSLNLGLERILLAPGQPASFPDFEALGIAPEELPGAIISYQQDPRQFLLRQGLPDPDLEDTLLCAKIAKDLGMSGEEEITRKDLSQLSATDTATRKILRNPPALFMAVEQDNYLCVNYLLKFGADINFQYDDPYEEGEPNNVVDLAIQDGKSSAVVSMHDFLEMTDQTQNDNYRKLSGYIAENKINKTTLISLKERFDSSRRISASRTRTPPPAVDASKAEMPATPVKKDNPTHKKARHL